MFNRDTEDVITEDEMRKMLAQEAKVHSLVRKDLDNVSDDFADMQLTADELAAIAAVQEPAQADLTLRKQLIKHNLFPLK
ncbi:hypothetical protein FRC06_011833 [Ceratobasidium sp. 370]|nr:hypothetical protein FRC06_011833 [Ceratobasidium sp. 370]